MIDKSKQYWVNNPIFLKIKDYFDIRYFSRVRELKKVHVNERIVEIPFTLHAVAKLHTGAEVLDIGCSESILPLYVSYSGLKVTGLDYRDYPYTAPNFRFTRGDILNLPFNGSSFDAVTCISTLEHIGIGFYNDPKQNTAADLSAIQEIKRVLRPNGFLVLSVPYGLGASNAQQRIYDHAALNELMKGFKISMQEYYSDSTLQGAICNMWVEITKEKADKIDCSKKVQCVSCLIATPWR
jgi:SAM-dependent methyltransferase